jgi:hypothetical protein
MTPGEANEGAMNTRLYIVTLSLLLLTRPVVADEADTFLWDSNVPGAASAALDREALCRPNPYGLYRRGCAQRELNAHAEEQGPRLTLLDELALFVYRYKDLGLAADLEARAKLKFSMNLLNLYEQEAKARVELKIPF